jgi:hypothetical protein
MPARSVFTHPRPTADECRLDWASVKRPSQPHDLQAGLVETGAQPRRTIHSRPSNLLHGWSDIRHAARTHRDIVDRIFTWTTSSHRFNSQGNRYSVPQGCGYRGTVVAIFDKLSQALGGDSWCRDSDEQLHIARSGAYRFARFLYYAE